VGSISKIIISTLLALLKGESISTPTVVTLTNPWVIITTPPSTLLVQPPFLMLVVPNIMAAEAFAVLLELQTLVLDHRPAGLRMA
jgi:hypothetical protein